MWFVFDALMSGVHSSAGLTLKCFPVSNTLNLSSIVNNAIPLFASLLNGARGRVTSFFNTLSIAVFLWLLKNNCPLLSVSC